MTPIDLIPVSRNSFEQDPKGYIRTTEGEGKYFQALIQKNKQVLETPNLLEILCTAPVHVRGTGTSTLITYLLLKEGVSKLGEFIPYRDHCEGYPSASHILKHNGEIAKKLVHHLSEFADYQGKLTTGNKGLVVCG